MAPQKNNAKMKEIRQKLELKQKKSSNNFFCKENDTKEKSLELEK